MLKEEINHRPNTSSAASPQESLSEDSIKRVLQSRLIFKGWQVNVAWGKTPGIDVDAVRGGKRRIIEVKGQGSRPQMRVNYFLAVLGEILQKMTDPRAKYSIALQQSKNTSPPDNWKG